MKTVLILVCSCDLLCMTIPSTEQEWKHSRVSEQYSGSGHDKNPSGAKPQYSRRGMSRRSPPSHFPNCSTRICLKDKSFFVQLVATGWPHVSSIPLSPIVAIRETLTYHICLLGWRGSTSIRLQILTGEKFWRQPRLLSQCFVI